jgi:hypothetical protein
MDVCRLKHKPRFYKPLTMSQAHTSNWGWKKRCADFVAWVKGEQDMTKDEALRLALEALEMFCEHGAILRPIETRDAIKEALAQTEQDGKCKHCTDGCPACDARKLPEQEPVAVQEGDVGIIRYADISVGKIIHNSPSTQRTWLGLTGEEIEASKPTRSNDAVVWELAVEWAEAKLKEKNT